MCLSVNAKPPMVFEGLEDSRPIRQLSQQKRVYFGFVNITSQRKIIIFTHLQRLSGPTIHRNCASGGTL